MCTASSIESRRNTWLPMWACTPTSSTLLLALGTIDRPLCRA
jgi:hypothetical protein